MTIQRHYIFDEVKRLRGKGFTHAEVQNLDRAIDQAFGEDVARRISAEGLDLIKRSEGLRLNAYKCPADVATIGYGSTGPHVKMGMTITVDEAEDLLRDDLVRFEQGVAKAGGTMTQGQFDAMVSLAFNIGLGAFMGSTLLQKHLAAAHDTADQFKRWNKGGGRVLPGLVTRRADEAKLYRGTP